MNKSELEKYLSQKSELIRVLGFREAISIIVNRIIGSGIFRTPGPILLAVGTVQLFFGVWIIGAIATLLGALCYAELSAIFPKSGGPYVFLRVAYKPSVTFLRGWAMFFVSETGAIVAVAIFFSETLAKAIFNQADPIYVFISSLFIIWLSTLINVLGVKLGGIIQNIFGLLKISSLIAVAILGFVGGLNLHHFTSDAVIQNTNTSFFASVLLIGEALRYGFFAYSGWEGATYVAEEIKNPSKNLPKSLFWGIASIMLIYLLVNVGYINALGPDVVKNSKVVAIDLLHSVFGVASAVVIALVLAFNALGNVNTQIMVKSRTWFAMARDGFFSNKLSKVHGRFNTPYIALLAQALWATVLLLFAVANGRAYETVIDFFSATSTIFNILTFYSLIQIRKKFPDLVRPYKAFGYPITIILVLLIQLTFLAVTLYTAFLPSIIGLLLTSSGLIYYYFRRNKIKIAD